jgi:hypothetical protein
MITFKGITLKHGDKVKILKPVCSYIQKRTYKYDERFTYTIGNPPDRLVRLVSTNDDGFKDGEYEEATEIRKL